jgi:hypothetical protein
MFSLEAGIRALDKTLWLIYVSPALTLNNATLRLQKGSKGISEYTRVISLNSLNRLDIVMEMQYVACEVRTELVNII